MHGIGGAGGVALQCIDLFGDLFRRALGLHRERFHFGRDDRKALARSARARGLDGRVEREQRRLPRDLRDQIDDVADGGGGLAQAVDIGAGFLRRGTGLVGELAGLANLRADAQRGLGKLVGGMGEGGCGRLCGVGAAGQGVGPVADGRKGCGGRFGAAGHRIGGALELANHRAQLEFQQFQDFPGRIALSGRAGLGMGRRRRSLRGGRGRSHVRQTLPK
ncbi:hypothetical protein ACVINX_004355 [Bradyrhizobium diazoefficiens]